MSTGELTQESIELFIDHVDPLTEIRETIGEWQIGTFGISRLRPTFRSGYGGKLTPSSRFRKQPFGPTKLGRSGLALIFRQFDSSQSQPGPSEYFVGWVPSDREAALEQWLAFLNEQIHKRLEGIASDQTQAQYSYGNPHAPFGVGGVTIDLNVDGTVRLVHNRQGDTRAWTARALPSLWTALNVAIATSKFPTRPSVQVAAAGKESFTFSVTRDGKQMTTTGFVSPEYRDVTILFGDIIAQMTKDEVLGFEPPTTTNYVAEVRTDGRASE